MVIKPTTLGSLVRKSPFKPIKEHMDMVFNCVCVVPALFDALYKRDQESVKTCAEQINKLETEADKLKSAFSLNMPTSLLMPVDRKDLLSLVSEQDHIAGMVEEIAQILVYRDMEVPEPLRPLLDELLEGTMEICTDAKSMVDGLNKLLEVGFRGREMDNIIEIIRTVRKSEHNIDNIIFRCRRSLFEIEKQLDPVSVIFWYKIIEQLGSLSDLAENMADRVLLFLSK